MNQALNYLSAEQLAFEWSHTRVSSRRIGTSSFSSSDFEYDQSINSFIFYAFFSLFDLSNKAAYSRPVSSKVKIVLISY